MSRFKKKSRKGPKVYKVRDALEIFKNSKAVIRIKKPRSTDPKFSAWIITVMWDYTKERYDLCGFPAEILDRIIMKVEIEDKRNIVVYI